MTQLVSESYQVYVTHTFYHMTHLHTAQWESARPNLDLSKIEARSEVSA